MDDALRTELKSAGWRSGTHKGFLMTSRAGIEFQVGRGRGAEAGRLELRYRYRTETTNAEGEVALPEDATRSAIEDAMTGIYLRVHEKPDPTRVFGGRRRGARGGGVSGPAQRQSAPAGAGEEPADAGQGALEL